MLMNIKPAGRTARIFLTMLLFFVLHQHVMGGQAWQASVQELNGLPLITKGGGDVVSASFIFWGKDWSYANFEPRLTNVSPGTYRLKGRNEDLGFDLDARITRASGQQLVWDIDLEAASERKHVVGGGIEFGFALDRHKELGEPQILADKSGWSWGQGTSRIEYRIQPKPADIFFERGRRDTLRIFFYQNRIDAGKTRYQAVLTLPQHFAFRPTTSERFGSSDTSGWLWGLLDAETSPVDLSFLNQAERPAGKRGFISAKGDQLVFADGTQARFWGTNVTAYALLETPVEQVKVHARRLSALGFNLVRLHHHDSYWMERNIFGSGKQRHTRKIDEAAIRKIDWWIKCLKDEGIYVWLDLHVQRKFGPEDGIDLYDETSREEGADNLKGFNYVNASIQKAMRTFNEAYLNHVNHYTKISYKDEPAIVAVLITNENDLTHHYGNALLPDKDVPQHSKIFMSNAAGFARAKGLSADETGRTWEHGPSKLFLNDMEHRFNADMMTHLRELGVKVPIVTTNSWGKNPLSSLPALTSGDMIDVHSYQEFGALEKNPLFASNLTHWIAAAQVVDKPLSVSEWNAEPFPTHDRHTLPIYMAGQASLQGWDAMMQYAYSQEPLSGEGSPSNWHAYNDPSFLATMPAAALLYRRGDVRQAQTTYVFNPGQKLFGQMINPENSVLLRTAAEVGRLSVAMPENKSLPWLKKSRIPDQAVVMDDPATSLIKGDAAEVLSDTQEIRHHWEKGFLTINTARTQAVAGWIGGEELGLKDVDFSVKTPNATVSVQSGEEAPISSSRKIIISLAARSKTRADWQLPFLSEPVEGMLRVRAPKGLKLYMATAQKKMKELPVKYENGRYEIALGKATPSYWLFLR